MMASSSGLEPQRTPIGPSDTRRDGTALGQRCGLVLKRVPRAVLDGRLATARLGAWMFPIVEAKAAASAKGRLWPQQYRYLRKRRHAIPNSFSPNGASSLARREPRSAKATRPSQTHGSCFIRCAAPTRSGAATRSQRRGDCLRDRAERLRFELLPRRKGERCRCHGETRMALTTRPFTCSATGPATRTARSRWHV